MDKGEEGWFTGKLRGERLSVLFTTNGSYKLIVQKAPRPVYLYYTMPIYTTYTPLGLRCWSARYLHRQHARPCQQPSWSRRSCKDTACGSGGRIWCRSLSSGLGECPHPRYRVGSHCPAWTAHNWHRSQSSNTVTKANECHLTANQYCLEMLEVENYFSVTLQLFNIL